MLSAPAQQRVRTEPGSTVHDLLHISVLSGSKTVIIGLPQQVARQTDCTRMIFLYFAAHAQDFLFIRELRAALRWERAERGPSEQRARDGGRNIH